MHGCVLRGCWRSDDGSPAPGAELSLAFGCVIRKRGVLRTHIIHSNEAWLNYSIMTLYIYHMYCLDNITSLKCDTIKHVKHLINPLYVSTVCLVSYHLSPFPIPWQIITLLVAVTIWLPNCQNFIPNTNSSSTSNLKFTSRGNILAGGQNYTQKGVSSGNAERSSQLN